MVVQTSEFLAYNPPASGESNITEIAPGPGTALICPRCESRLHINYDEPQCLQCGYVDYR